MLDLENGITVLSTFDGMACGMIALQRAGIKVKAYYASEIDKPAMKVAKHNWPEIIHIGDVTKVHYAEGWLFTENGEFYVGKVDLLIGGSPCQGFSFAGKQLNFEDPRSKLFFEYVRLREETGCEYFFLENVVMKQEFQDVISNLLNCKPIFINSELVSAQQRKRLYWTNIPFYGLPKDKGILLKHILEYEVKEDYLLSDKAIDYMGRKVKGGRSHWDFAHHHDSDNPKSSCIVANTYKGVPYNVLITEEALSRIIRKKYSQPRIYPEKTGTINTKNNSGQLSVDSGTTLIPVGKYLRRLTEIECERLQTVDDNYTAIESSTQRYRMLGNGWNVDTIVHFFEPLLYVI